jgi:hypothetical protein
VESLVVDEATKKEHAQYLEGMLEKADEVDEMEE